jgi:hypothetical protein
LRQACSIADAIPMDLPLRKTINEIQSTKRSSCPSKYGGTGFYGICEEDNAFTHEEIQRRFPNRAIKLYRACFVGENRFGSISQTSVQRTDGCILFILNNKPAIGFVENTVVINERELLFQVKLVSIKQQLHINLSNASITCRNIWKGHFDATCQTIFIKPTAIVEKIIHIADKKLNCFLFFRISNLFESS